ncbi:hypothetical protein [Deinococcus hohokamensis]|uniref:Transposase n=1 Tax=Deinococcus hohokamensis TaxID=309883 RepID=A0ABV9ID93_9DEIO
MFDLQASFSLRKKLFVLCQRAGVTYRAWQTLRNAAGVRLLQREQELAGPESRPEVRRQLGLTSRESIRPLVKLSRKNSPA